MVINAATFSASAGLAEDGHVTRVAAEVDDVVAHPFEDRYEVERTHVA
jgi:hypothetical protein